MDTASLDLLADMYKSGYFPNPLVDQVKDALLWFISEAESKNVTTLEALYPIAHAATEKINDLQEAFYDAGSEIETGARESIGEAFEKIATAVGFPNADVEELMAPRDW